MSHKIGVKACDFHPYVIQKSPKLHAVKLFSGDDGDVVFLQQFDALIRAVKAEDQNCGIAALLYESVHVFDVDACILQHGEDRIQSAGDV